MSITKERTEELIKEFGKNSKDTGCVEAQVAILTERVNNLSGHLQDSNKKDFQARHGLLAMVHQRRRLMKYLKRQDDARYESLRKKLGLRK